MKIHLQSGILVIIYGYLIWFLILICSSAYYLLTVSRHKGSISPSLSDVQLFILYLLSFILASVRFSFFTKYKYSHLTSPIFYALSIAVFTNFSIINTSKFEMVHVTSPVLFLFFIPLIKKCITSRCTRPPASRVWNSGTLYTTISPRAGSLASLGGA